MWKTLAALALAVTGAGLPWERSMFSPMHDAPNELFGTKKTPPKNNKQTKNPNQNQQKFGLGAARPSQPRWCRELCCHLLVAPRMAPAGGRRTLPALHENWHFFAWELALVSPTVYRSPCSSFQSTPSANVSIFLKTKKKSSNGGKTFVKRLDFSWFPSAPFPPSLLLQALRSGPQSAGSGHSLCTQLPRLGKAHWDWGRAGASEL